MRRAESRRRDAVEWTVNPQPRRQKTGGHPGGPPSVGQFTNVTKLEVELARSQTGRKGNARDSLIACVVFQPHSPLVGIADSLSYRSLRWIVTFKWRVLRLLGVDAFCLFVCLAVGGFGGVSAAVPSPPRPSTRRGRARGEDTPPPRRRRRVRRRSLLACEGSRGSALSCFRRGICRE